MERLAGTLRNLAWPVIGRIEDGGLILDLRCLTDEAAFLSVLSMLATMRGLEMEAGLVGTTPQIFGRGVRLCAAHVAAAITPVRI